jgi:hypothetical protein
MVKSSMDLPRSFRHLRPGLHRGLRRGLAHALALGAADHRHGAAAAKRWSKRSRERWERSKRADSPWILGDFREKIMGVLVDFNGIFMVFSGFSSVF